MHDEPVISRTCVIAWALWAAVAGCLLAMFMLWGASHALLWGTVGCMLSAAAATMSIRSFFIAFAKREHDAFRMGREVGRSEGGSGVRQIR